jgi:hypothetical protein
VAERARQLASEKGPRFEPRFVRAFVETLRAIPVEFPGFALETALSAWPEVTGRYPAGVWCWENAPPACTRPCAERCRTGDHIVYAIAREHEAVLVTNDRKLREQAELDCYEPGAMSLSEFCRRAALP